MTDIESICATMELRLLVSGRPCLPVVADLTYTAADPWAVRVALRTGSDADDVVEWLFARDLLADGARTATGEGDVRVWPVLADGERSVRLSMVSPSGAAVFGVDRPELLHFLERTLAAVPRGSEQEVVDLDAELSLLLRADRG